MYASTFCVPGTMLLHRRTVTRIQLDFSMSFSYGSEAQILRTQFPTTADTSRCFHHIKELRGLKVGS